MQQGYSPNSLYLYIEHQNGSIYIHIYVNICYRCLYMYESMDIPSEILISVISYISNKSNILLTCRLWYNILCANDDSIVHILYERYPYVCIHDMVYEAILYNDVDIVHRVLYEYSGYLPIRWDILHDHLYDIGILHRVYTPIYDNTPILMRYMYMIHDRRYDDMIDLASRTGHIPNIVWPYIPYQYRMIMIDNNYIHVSDIRKASYTDSVPLIDDTGIDLLDIKEIYINDSFNMFIFFYEDMILSLHKCIDLIHGDILYYILCDRSLSLQYYRCLCTSTTGSIDRSMCIRSLLDRDINRYLLLAISILLNYVDVIDIYMTIYDAMYVYAYLSKPIGGSMMEILNRRSMYVREYNAIINIDRNNDVPTFLLQSLYSGASDIGNETLIHAIDKR